MLSFIPTFRFLITLKALLTYTIMCMQRNGFNLEILCMACDETNSTANSTVRDCFAWDKNTLGLLEGAFFWGYAVSQVFSGVIMHHFGFRWPINFAIFLSSACTFLIPFAASAKYPFIMFLRVVTGVGQGFLGAFSQNLVSAWSPEDERSVHLSTITCGIGIGPAIALVLSGIFCEFTLPYSKYIFFRTGWATYFYFSGGLGLIDLMLSILLITDSPESNRFVSKQEKNYILSNIEHRDTSTKKSIPWIAIFKSIPVYAFIFSLSFSDVGIYAVWTVVPQFMADILKFDLTSNGLYSSLCYIFHVAAILLAGFLSKVITTHKYLSNTNSCKLFQAVGCVGSAICLAIISYTNKDLRIVAIALLIVGFTFHGLILGGGILIICNDFAGSFAGLVFAIGNTVSGIFGFFVPFLTDKIVKDSLPEQWRIAFLTYACSYILSAVILLVFGSSEVQPWAKDTVVTKKANENEQHEDGGVVVQLNTLQRMDIM